MMQYIFFLAIYLQLGDFIGDVLEFGFWAILIFVVIVVLLIVWIVKKVKNSRRDQRKF
ncbi:MAG: hypothetical protein ACNS62_04915 [Candidatus Cyclobacteriaceae bacterium M3_2C_046]